VPLSSTELLVLGGWNQTPLQEAFILLGGSQEHNLKHVMNNLAKPDFFLVNFVAWKEQNQLKIMGHGHFHSFDLNTQRFVS